ncbi:MAG: hypothetical protein MHM6MM_006677 [Cercozoa sp. M6MM]
MRVSCDIERLLHSGAVTAQFRADDANDVQIRADESSFLLQRGSDTVRVRLPFKIDAKMLGIKRSNDEIQITTRQYAPPRRGELPLDRADARVRDAMRPETVSQLKCQNCGTSFLQKEKLVGRAKPSEFWRVSAELWSCHHANAASFAPEQLESGHVRFGEGTLEVVREDTCNLEEDTVNLDLEDSAAVRRYFCTNCGSCVGFIELRERIGERGNDYSHEHSPEHSHEHSHSDEHSHHSHCHSDDFVEFDTDEDANLVSLHRHRLRDRTFSRPEQFLAAKLFAARRDNMQHRFLVRSLPSRQSQDNESESMKVQLMSVVETGSVCTEVDAKVETSYSLKCFASLIPRAEATAWQQRTGAQVIWLAPADFASVSNNVGSTRGITVFAL